MEQKLIEMKGEIDNPKLLLATPTPLSWQQMQQLDRKVTKDMEEFNSTINQRYITGIYRTFYSTMAEYRFFPSADGTFTKIDHKLGRKTNLNTFKRTEIQNVFSDYHGIKLGLNNRQVTGKSHGN